MVQTDFTPQGMWKMGKKSKQMQWNNAAPYWDIHNSPSLNFTAHL